MKFHPYSEIFPLIEGAAFDELVADLKANGLREKIWLYDGQILDGRNRFFACQKAKIKPDYRKFTGSDPLAFVISLNVQRRHLTESQRAMAAARIATMQKGANQHASIEAPSQDKAAESLKVGRSSVQRARKVIEDGSKALQNAVESGEVSVSKAAAVVDLPKSEQLAAAKAKPPKPETGADSFEPEPFDLDEAEEAAALDRASAEIDKSIAKVMESDDRFPVMQSELKRLAGLLSITERSRDHYQTQCGVATRMVKERDREVARLEKKLTKANEEIEALKERVAIMESSG